MSSDPDHRLRHNGVLAAYNHGCLTGRHAEPSPDVHAVDWFYPHDAHLRAAFCKGFAVGALDRDGRRADAASAAVNAHDALERLATVHT